MNPQEYSQSNLVLTISEQPGLSSPAAISVTNTVTGEVIGDVETAAYPTALLRTSRAELLVSDIVIHGGASLNPRLRIIDISDGFSVKRSIALPHRIAYTIFAPTMTLSNDGLLIYYLKRTEECPGPSELCDTFSIGIIELDTGLQVAEGILPRNAWYALLIPRGLASMLAMCPEISRIVEVTSDGAVSEVASFTPPTIDLGTGSGAFARPIYAGISANQQPYMLFHNGTLKIDSGATLHLLSNRGHLFNGIARWPLNNNRAILGLNHGFAGAIDEALLFDAAKPGRTEFLALPEGTTFLAPLTNDRAVALHAQRMSTINLSTGLVEYEVDAPEHSSWPVGSTN